MSPSEAREHLEMAERIVAASTRQLSLRCSAPFFIVWGIAAGSVDLLFGLGVRGVIPANILWVTAIPIVLAIIFSAVYGRKLRRSESGVTFLEREFLNVLWIAMSVAFVANMGAWNVFGWYGIGANYTLAASIVLFYIGLHANRRALAGGIVMLVSLIVANFTASLGGFVLCAGFYIGYAGFGVAELLARE